MLLRRASPRLAWEDLRSRAPSQIRPSRCVSSPLLPFLKVAAFKTLSIREQACPVTASAELAKQSVRVLFAISSEKKGESFIFIDASSSPFILYPRYETISRLSSKNCVIRLRISCRSCNLLSRKFPKFTEFRDRIAWGRGSSNEVKRNSHKRCARWRHSRVYG